MTKNAEAGTAPIVQKEKYPNIYAALSAFQGEMKPIEQSAKVNFKTKSGDTVDFSYAPLGKIMEVINPVLAKHGLSVRHEITEKSVECILTHETTSQNGTLKEIHYIARDENVGGKDRELYGDTFANEIRSGKLPIDLSKSDMKEVGGQITYGRRYTLGLVLGLATEEDKDTELMEQSRKGMEKFAFAKAKESVEKTSGDKLGEQLAFLEKELALAKAVENGEGDKAPSLGLKTSQYEELIKLAKSKVEKKDVVDVEK